MKERILMGYRSEVAVRFSEKASEVVKHFYEMDKQIKELIDGAEFCDDFSSILWGWIKWYDDFEDIAAFMHMLDQLGEENYGMIRMGEDYDDVEYYGDPPSFDMYVNRSIQW
jgi:hypothetical protein